MELQLGVGEGWTQGSLSPPHTFMEKCLEISGLILVPAACSFMGKRGGGKVSFGVTALIPVLALHFLYHHFSKLPHLGRTANISLSGLAGLNETTRDPAWHKMDR